MLPSTQAAGPLTALFAARDPVVAASKTDEHGAVRVEPRTGLAALLASSTSDGRRAGKSASTAPLFVPFAASAPTLPADWAPAERTALLRSVRQLLEPSSSSQDPNTRSFGSLYDICRSLVVHADAGEDIYDGLRGALQRAVGARASSLRAAGSDPKPEAAFAWLDSLAATWQEWCDRVVSVRKAIEIDFPGLMQAWANTRTSIQELVRSILSPLDQIYVLPRKDRGVVSIRYVVLTTRVQYEHGGPQLTCARCLGCLPSDLAMNTFKESIIDDAELQQRLFTAVTLAVNAER